QRCRRRVVGGGGAGRWGGSRGGGVRGGGGVGVPSGGGGRSRLGVGRRRRIDSDVVGTAAGAEHERAQRGGDGDGGTGGGLHTSTYSPDKSDGIPPTTPKGRPGLREVVGLGPVAGADEAAFVGEHDGVDPVAYLELSEQPVDVGLDRRIAHVAQRRA